MHQEHGAEVTFAVHPRPDTAHAEPPELPEPPEPLLWHFDVAPRGTAAEDVSRHRDTAAGDLAFLARFAFGHY